MPGASTVRLAPARLASRRRRAQRAGFIAGLALAAVALAGCAATGAADPPCPGVPGMTAVPVVLADFGLEGVLPPGHCDYEDTTGSYAEDRFAIAVWRTLPEGIVDAVAALAAASGFAPENASDPQFPSGELVAWRDGALSGAVIAFSDLPASQAPAGYEGFAGEPLAWVGLHAPRP